MILSNETRCGFDGSRPDYEVFPSLVRRLTTGGDPLDVRDLDSNCLSLTPLEDSVHFKFSSCQFREREALEHIDS